MKTNGSTYSRTGTAVLILFLLALIAGVPCFSQVKYALQRSTSFAAFEKKPAANFQDYYAVTEPSTARVQVASLSSGASYPAKINSLADPLDEKNSSTGMVNYDKPGKGYSLIKFKPTSYTYPKNAKADVGIAEYPAAQLILYAKALKQYAKKHGYDTSYAFLSNMGMLCNKKRFFVINLITMQIELSGLVSHGRGQGASIYDKQYSNKSGSRCTSLGRYKITGKYTGGYGQAYRMIGLDSSNRNVYRRNIVLHSMDCIPDIDGVMPACVSEGCPSVSTKFLSSLRAIIDSRKKPVLLWIFDSNLEEAVVAETPGPQQQTHQYNTAVNKDHTCSIHFHDNPVVQ